jgi:hypothetical protein
MVNTLSLQSLVAAAAGQVSSEVEGEEVILNLATGTYYGLNAVGARIWALVKEPCTVAHICDTIVDEYEVERERCEQDVLALLAQLAEVQLIEVRDVPTPDASAADSR